MSKSELPPSGCRTVLMPCRLSVRWELLSAPLVTVFSLSIWNILGIPWLAWIWQRSPDSPLVCSNPPHLSLPNARTIIYASLDVSFYLNFDFIFFPSCVAYIYEYMCVWGMLACVCADGGQTSTPRALSSTLHLTFWDRNSHWGWGPPFPLDLLTCGPPCVCLSCAGITEVCYHTPCLRGCWG